MTFGANTPEKYVRRALLVYLRALEVLWVVALSAIAIQSQIFHRAYPYNTLFFFPEIRFSDLSNVLPRCPDFKNSDFFFAPLTYPFTGPAPLLICVIALCRWTSQPVAVYLIMVLVFAILTCLLADRMVPENRTLKGLPSTVCVSAVMFSFPLFFLLDRGNLEGFVWMATSLGLVLFVGKRYLSSALLLGFATSLKLFPLLLLLLFIAKRRYRDFAISLAAATAFTFISLWAIGPSLSEAAKGVALAADVLRRGAFLKFHIFEIGFDHSLYGFVKHLLFLWTGDTSRVERLLPHIYVIYAVAAVLGTAALYLFRLRRLPVLNQLLALSLLSILLPFISNDYTLVNLIVPFFVLVLFLVRDVSTGRVEMAPRHMIGLLLPWAIIFAPLSYLIVDGAGFGGQVRTIAIIYLILLASKRSLPSSLFEELDEPITADNVIAACPVCPTPGSASPRLASTERQSCQKAGAHAR